MITSAALIALLSAVFILLLGYRVYNLDRSKRQYQAFGALCTMLAWMCFCWYEMEQTQDLASAVYWRKLQSVWALCNPLIIYCCYLYASMQLRKPATRWKWVLLSTILLPSLVFFGLELFSEDYKHGRLFLSENGVWMLHFRGDSGLISMARGLWTFLTYGFAVYFIGLVWREETIRFRKVWLTILLLLLSLGGSISILQNYILPSGDMSFPINESWNTVVSVITFGWAISDFRIFDLKPESAFEHVSNSMFNLMIITNVSFRIKECNPAALKFFHTDAQTARNAPLHKVIGNSTAHQLTHELQHGSERELTFIHDQKQSHLLFSISVIQNRWGRRIGYVFVGNDLTDFHQAMAEVQHYNERLQASNEALESFAYAVSHDLKQPLRTVHGFVNLLNRKVAGQDDPEVREYIHFINQGIVRMNALIDSMLTLSRLGNEQEEDEAVNLERVLLEVKDKLRALCEQKNASIQFEAPLPVLTGKHHQISLLFQNLIENGIKYNKSETPVVKIACRPVAQGSQFSVVDNGIGIAPKYREQVFQMFKRLHSWADYEGTGIGLTMCHKIVKGLGGRIWIESPQSGQGTTFNFIIPETKLAKTINGRIPASS